MFTALRRVVTLSWGERQLLVTVAVSLVMSRALLTTAGLDRTHRVIDRVVRVLPPNTTIQDPEEIPWAVNATAECVPLYFSCLMRAIVGERLFAKNGYRTELHLGVTKDTGFEAHAWVEHDGEVVVGDLDDHDRFQPLDTFQSNGSVEILHN